MWGSLSRCILKKGGTGLGTRREGLRKVVCNELKGFAHVFRGASGGGKVSNFLHGVGRGEEEGEGVKKVDKRCARGLHVFEGFGWVSREVKRISTLCSKEVNMVVCKGLQGFEWVKSGMNGSVGLNKIQCGLNLFTWVYMVLTGFQWFQRDLHGSWDLQGFQRGGGDDVKGF